MLVTKILSYACYVLFSLYKSKFYSYLSSINSLSKESFIDDDSYFSLIFINQMAKFLIF